jgi:hypothetical protein
MDSSTATFFNRLSDLELNAAEAQKADGLASSAAAAWDEIGECPCCKRGPGEVVTPDPGSERLEDLIEQLLADLGEPE